METFIQALNQALPSLGQSLTLITPAILILIVGWLLTGWLRKLLLKILTRKMDVAPAHFLGQISHILLLIILFIVVLSQLGVNTTSLIAALGAAGLAIGLALKDSLQNLASGFLLVALEPFKKGDFIEGAGTSGSVDRLTLSHTYLKTPDNKLVMVPNSALIHSNLTNYSTEPRRRIDINLGVSYATNLEQVKTLLLDLASQEQRVLQDPAPLIAVVNLGEKSVELTLRIWVNSTDFWPTRWSLLEQIKLAFDAANLSLVLPQLVIQQAENT